ncbi:MAG: hypothetical protein ITG04_00640 [Proteiniphilum sp.]|nr:hypothetical protein [Proteiniphilum sp.]NLY24184.1 hypothetical protein [Bacteroidales bacterium]
MRRVLFILFGLMISVVAMAAEEIASLNLDISIDYSNDPFYGEIWFWAIVSVPFLFLLVLLVRGGKVKRVELKEVVKKAPHESD